MTTSLIGAVYRTSELLNCPLNGKPLTKAMSLAPCMHKFNDSKELRNIFAKKHPRCPTCKMDVTGRYKDLTMRELVNTYSRIGIETLLKAVEIKNVSDIETTVVRKDQSQTVQTVPQKSIRDLSLDFKSVFQSHRGKMSSTPLQVLNDKIKLEVNHCSKPSEKNPDIILRLVPMGITEIIEGITFKLNQKGSCFIGLEFFTTNINDVHKILGDFDKSLTLSPSVRMEISEIRHEYFNFEPRDINRIRKTYEFVKHHCLIPVEKVPQLDRIFADHKNNPYCEYRN